MTDNNPNENDHTDRLVEAVNDAVSQSQPLHIQGGGTKSFLGRPSSGTVLSTLEHCGVVSYEPTELVVTVRTGTRIQDLNDLLTDNGQMLPFEPPVLVNGTVGGVLACGLSGPARPFAGSVRDYVLGMRVINGKGEALRFGGEVMKNVAGYDAARLHVGAYGTLGVLLETSFKVLPVPEAQITLHQELDSELDNSALIKLMREPYPISAAAIDGRSQYIRLSGSELAVHAAARSIGGEIAQDGESFWQQLRELEHAFFDGEKPLWRLSVPDYTDALSLPGDYLYDWAGAQRYLKTDTPAEQIYKVMNELGGHASCITPDKLSQDAPVFQPLTGPMRDLQARVRDSFDAQRLFNRGRYHPELDNVASEPAGA